jgi:hypothetical protein
MCICNGRHLDKYIHTHTHAYHLSFHVTSSSPSCLTRGGHDMARRQQKIKKQTVQPASLAHVTVLTSPVCTQSGTAYARVKQRKPS